MDGMIRTRSWSRTTCVGRGDGGGGRRRWSSARKAAIVAESFVAGVKVSEVAARYDLRASQLSTWRRRAKPAEPGSCVRPVEVPPGMTLDFVPVTVSTVTTGLQADTRSAQGMASPSALAPNVIEIMLGDASIRVAPGVDAATLSRVLAAVRRGGR